MLHSGKVYAGCGGESVMAVREKCDERRRGVRPDAAIPTPTHSKERECVGHPMVGLQYIHSSWE